jgi:hypothetical protein
MADNGRQPHLQRLLVGIGLLIAVFGAFIAVDALTGDDGAVVTVPGPAQALGDPDAGDSADGSDSDSDTDSAGQLDVTGTTAGSARTEPGAEPSAEADQAQAAALPGAPSGAGDGGSTVAFEAIRNRQDKFTNFADVPSDQLDLAALTENAPKADNGGSPEGQFRVACEYSHFGYDDPIIHPNQPGASHLHMFFGNTEVNAFTTLDSLVNTGGGTCSGFELNRSGYWTPALLDGRGNVIVPDQIIIYYKTKYPGQVSPLPQGMQMLAGNFDAESFETRNTLHWSCGSSGNSYNKTNRIPDCGGDVINASIQFPNCWDGVNLSSDDFVSHLTFVDEELPCPGSHPVRLPQITILMYFPGASSVDGWRLSSDDVDGYNGPPGGTLHADWWGGWNDEAMDLWINGCMRASRNCSFGQTGTSRQLASLNRIDAYRGENVLPLP